MAIKDQGCGLDFLKVSIIKDALMNPLTTAQITTLAGTLGAGHKGLQVYDTDLSILKTWNGSAFAQPPAAQTGLTPKGNKAFNDAEPGSPVIGDLYVFTTAGDNTWEGTTTVQIGDQVYWDGTIWQFVQGNQLASSETVAGFIELATQAEVNTGTDSVRGITPATQKGYHDNKKVARVYFAAGITTVADVALTVNHALGLQNRNAFVVNFMVSNSQVDVDVDSIDANNITITHSAAVTGDITVIGY